MRSVQWLAVVLILLSGCGKKPAAGDDRERPDVPATARASTLAGGEGQQAADGRPGRDGQDLQVSVKEAGEPKHAEGPVIRAVLGAGHTETVTSVSYSGDGKLLATASRDTAVMLWDAATRKHARTLKHKYPVNAVAFAPGGTTLASATDDGVVILWDAATGKQLTELKHDDGTEGFTLYPAVNALAFSRDGKLLASGGVDKTVKVWDVVDCLKGKRPPKVTLKGHAGGVRAVAFSRDGKLASGGLDGKVKLWDVESGKSASTLEGHGDGVLSVAFSPDGKTLASAGGWPPFTPGTDEGDIVLWEVGTGKKETTFKGDKARVGAVAFSPDGVTLASAGPGGLKLRDLRGKKEATALLAGESLTTAAFAPGGKEVAVGTYGGMVSLLGLPAGKVRASLLGFANFPVSPSFSDDGKRLIFGTEKSVHVWDVDSGGYAVTATVNDAPAFPIIAARQVGKAGAVSADSFGGLRLWDTASGKQVARLGGDRDPVMSLAFSGDGNTVAWGAIGQKLKIRDVAGKKRVRIEALGSANSSCLAFTRDGKLLASGLNNNGNIPVWQLPDGKGYSLRGHGDVVNALAFDDEGKRLASASSDKTIRVWDVAAEKTVATFKDGTDKVACVALSPDGKTLAYGRGEVIDLREVAGGKVVWTLKGHAGNVMSVAFSRDGQRLVSTGEDKKVIVWDLPKSK